MIIWIVPRIAYTPEDYTVLYGTERDSLDQTSDMESSGDDIAAEGISLSLLLTGLQPETAYYYRVNSTNTYGSTLDDIGTFNTSIRRELTTDHVMHHVMSCDVM